MSSSLENQEALTKRFIQAEEAWDYEANIELRTTDCTQHLVPTTLGHPPRNNDEFREFYAQLKPLWTEFKIDVQHTTHDPETHTTVLHVINHSDSPAGKFELESIFTLWFTEDGTKLRKVQEFVDSTYLTEFFAKVAEVQSKDA